MTQPRYRFSRQLALGGVFTAALAAGCAASDPMPAAVPAARAVAPAPAVTDADIAAIVVAANGIDARMGELALSKSSNDEIRKFAQQMVTDHNGVNEAAVALVTRLGVTPTPNATSRGLETSAEQTHGRLSALEGAAFDRAYIANEIAYHQAVLNAVDNVLIPSAQNAELKATLVDVRPAFVAHLQRAQQVQRSLGASR